MSIEAIYLDIDGVLVDFVSRALALHGRPELLESWPKGVYSMEAVLGITTEEFWEPINRAGIAFWGFLPQYPWMQILLNACYQKTSRVVLISTQSHCPSSSAGKHLWINRYFGEDFRDFSLTPRKADCARPGRLLIDDYDRNCDQWREQGGQALLFPQKWNRGEGNINTILDALAAL